MFQQLVEPTLAPIPLSRLYHSITSYVGILAHSPALHHFKSLRLANVCFCTYVVWSYFNQAQIWTLTCLLQNLDLVGDIFQLMSKGHCSKSSGFIKFKMQFWTHISKEGDLSWQSF